MIRLLDGTKIAAEIRREVGAGVRRLRQEAGRVPGLAFITAGEDPASLAYVAMKERACKEAGIISWQFSFPPGAGEEQLLAKIRELNADRRVHGILVQLPLPGGIDPCRIIPAISPDKDVDGFHPVNMGRLLLGQDGFCPCTPLGIVELLIRSGQTWSGRHVVIVGRSAIVGKPLAALLTQRGARLNATVTLCHTGTPDIAEHTRRADIVVMAVGKAGFLKAGMIKAGAIVIDVGINRVTDKSAPRGYRLVGDVDFESVAPKSSAITPVPGGVGPMTIAMLLSNTLTAAGQIT